MNRSILIVICDFLLVSLLVFSTPDTSKLTNPDVTKSMATGIVTNPPNASGDLAAAMRLALEQEQKNRQQLLAQLSQARESANQQSNLLAQREQQVAAVQQQLTASEQQARQMLEQQNALQQQYSAAQTNLEALNQQLRSTSSESLVNQERVRSIQDDARKQAEQLEAMKRQLADMAQTNQQFMQERIQLAGELRLAQSEKQAAAEQAARMQDEVKVEREEKAKLAENVKTLANQSGKLAEEVRQNTPIAPNTLFNELVSNRVQASFTISKPGLFGDSVKHKDTQTILTSDGTNIFAFCHLEDTPFTFWRPGIDWQSMAGTLSGGMALTSIHNVIFDQQDPRVVLLPVSAAEARQFGCKIYHVSADPFKFQDAILVGAREGYYGECRFEIDLTTPQYVKLDRSFLKGLFGKFNPSSGDLVFSKGGELLGIMVNGTYCLMIHDLKPAATLQFGDNVTTQHTGETLARLHDTVLGMPFKLQ